MPRASRKPAARRSPARKPRAVSSPARLWLPEGFVVPDGASFDLKRARKVVRFVERLLRHTKGRWAGAAFVLEDWQRVDLIAPLFGIVTPDGQRFFREALIGLARKNGKSELCAALALYLTIADGEPGAEVYSVAADKDQARIVFGTAKAMALQSPTIRPWVKVYRDAIEVIETGAVYRALSSDAPRKHGLNPSAVVIDELHAHKDPELYYAMVTATGAREQPLVLSITTAGFDESTICFQRYQHGQAGVALEPRGLARANGRFFLYWREAPEGSELTDLEAWKAGNPASWRQTPEAHQETLESGLPEAVLRRLHFNQWTRVAERWLPMERWDACAGDPIIPDGAQVVVGVDAAPKRDTTAVALCYRDGEGTIHTRVRIFRADSASGLLDYDEVEDFIRLLARSYFVLEVRFDAYHFMQAAIRLMGEGINMVEFPQNDSRMVPASQALFTVVKDGRLRHGADPELREQADAAAAKETSRGWRLHKMKATRPIDAMVALAMAIDRWENSDDLSAPRLVVF